MEGLNFALTNRLPRRAATRFMGRFSRIEQPLVRAASIGLWRLFCDVDLSDARKTRFTSLHDCFVRELREGARPADPDPRIITSPCDAIVGACGRIEGGRLYQVKGSPYRLGDLVPGGHIERVYRDGCFATLRLTAGMYHHFHAPHDLVVEEVRYVPGDAWNVNPPALKRVDRLFCRNERAAILTRLAGTGHPLAIVPVAAILVAGLRLPFVGTLDLRPGGARRLPSDASFAKGGKMGWFEHGSTIILFAPSGVSLCEGVEEGRRIKAGEALMRLP